MFQKLKKSAIWIILFSVILGLAFPVYYANALPEWLFWTPGGQVFEWLSGQEISLEGLSPTNIFISGFFTILIAITSPFLSLSHSLLDWVTSTDFINISFTGPDNFIVQEGWGIVRDLVNMLIVLSFVIVALATILRIKEYQAQKLLPLLIGIALLINFTPVICGFFIDISNVAMNHFLTAGSLDRSIVETINYQTTFLYDQTGVSPAEKIGTGIVLVIFNLIATIIFLLFALLFAVRYVALWILIILSPLAFFCYVLPGLKGIWSMWWKQFFQWCIIGIPAAFFIYLSNMLIGEMTKKNLYASDPLGDLNIFAFLFSFTIPLVFLIVGFFVSLQTGAMGADKIISISKTGGTKAGAWAGRKVGETAAVKKTKEKVGRIGEWIPEKVGTKRMRIESEAEHHKKKAERVEKDMARLQPMSTKKREEFVEKGPADEKWAELKLAAKEGHLEDRHKDTYKTLGNIYATPEDQKDIGSTRLDWAADLNPEKVQKVMKEQGVKQDEAKKIVIREKVQGKQPVKIRQDTQAETFKSKDVVFSMSEAQVKEVTTRGSVEQKKEIYDTYAKEVEKLTGQSIYYGTTEELREKVADNTKDIQKQIDMLRNTGKSEDVAKAEAIKEIGIAIQRRRF